MSLSSAPNTDQEQSTARVLSSQVVGTYESDGKQFLEVWLIDPTWNKNYWKAHPDELTRKVEHFVGKPAILTPYLHHPHEYEHIEELPQDPEGNIRKYGEIDERYRIGHIIKIKPLQNAAYAGIIEITHAGACNAFKQGNIPRYVSPAVYNLNMTGPTGEFTSFEPLHIAFVDEPAYGAKATVTNSCRGEQQTCLRNLGAAAAAAMLPMGNACIAKALANLHSSYDKKNVSTASELSIKDDSATPPTAADNKDPKQVTVSTEDTNKESKAQQTTKKPETKEHNPKESTADKKDTPENKPADTPKKDDIAKFMEEIKASIKEQVTAAVKVIEDERQKKDAETTKRKLIETYVTLESCNGNVEEREKRIKSLMFIPDDTLQEFLEQHYKISGTGKTRTNAAKASKASDFNRGMSQNTQNVGTAALLLDQETNDRIDRILSIKKFVPHANIVPTSATAGDTA